MKGSDADIEFPVQMQGCGVCMTLAHMAAWYISQLIISINESLC